MLNWIKPTRQAVLFGCLLAFHFSLQAQSTDVFEFERKKPSQVQVLRDGKPYVPDGSGLKIELLPTKQSPNVQTPAIPMRQDQLMPVLWPNTHAPVTRTESEWKETSSASTNPYFQPISPIVGLKTEVIPSGTASSMAPQTSSMLAPIDSPSSTFHLQLNERTELEMWRKLTASPIQVTLRDGKAYIEWAGSQTQVEVPSHGMFQIKLAPTR